MSTFHFVIFRHLFWLARSTSQTPVVCSWLESNFTVKGLHLTAGKASDGTSQPAETLEKRLPPDIRSAFTPRRNSLSELATKVQRAVMCPREQDASPPGAPHPETPPGNPYDRSPLDSPMSTPGWMKPFQLVDDEKAIYKSTHGEA
jgi:hypothetical protein